MNEIQTYTLENQYGLKITVLNYGATLLDLIVPNRQGHPVNVSVRLQNPEDYLDRDYLEKELHIGGSIGRYAGRIYKTLKIGPEEFSIHTVDDVHLHGGKTGFDRKFWKLIEINQEENPFVLLEYVSPHLEEGYPGELRVQVKYQLLKSSLVIRYTATSDRLTALNLTNHAYFNLNGNGSIGNHDLLLNSSERLELDNDQVPTGKVLLNKSEFDFRELRKISGPGFIGLDHPFVLDRGIPAAVLQSPESGIRLTLQTNQPAVVVFTPPIFPEMPLSSSFGKFPAICLETQNYPDATNHPNFPSALLSRGTQYENVSTFTFDNID